MRMVSPAARLFAFATAAVLLAFGMARAEDRVFSNASDVEPLAPGARVPSASVEKVTGAPIDLAELVRDRGALLVFYRGGW